MFQGFLVIPNLLLCRPQVLDLDLSNFERITKVASGHTTGDWLVKVLSIDFLSVRSTSSFIAVTLQFVCA